jgi:hypothetical protein
VKLTFRARLADYKCRVLNALGWDWCICHGAWYPKNKRGELEGLCKQCSAFIEIDRLFRTSGYLGAQYRRTSK